MSDNEADSPTSEIEATIELESVAVDGYSRQTWATQRVDGSWTVTCQTLSETGDQEVTWQISAQRLPEVARATGTEEWNMSHLQRISGDIAKVAKLREHLDRLLPPLDRQVWRN